MSGKTWIIFVVVVVALFGGLAYSSYRNRIDVSDINTAKVQPAIEKNGNVADHVYGKADSKVVLIEYGDYQCPGCEKAYPMAKAVSEKYKDRIAFVFRNYPLTNAHANALAAAAAAETAGQLGKYWEMHDVLYQRQADWSDASGELRGDLFARYAREVGLDETKFNQTLEANQSQLRQKIRFDQAIGRKDGVTGTPSFYLNGKKLTDDEFNSVEALDAAVAKALEQS